MKVSYITAVCALFCTGFILGSGKLAHAQVLTTQPTLLAGDHPGQGDSAQLVLNDNWAQAATRNWRMAGRLAYPEGEAYLLNDGKVFAPAVDYLHPGSQIWSPQTNVWTAIPPMHAVRYGSATVVLADGRVLVTGGVSGSVLLNTAEIYDPRLNVWTPSAGVTSIARYQHRSTLLPGGRVLIVGGCSTFGCGNTARMAEIYDPAIDRFLPAGTLVFNLTAYSSTLLLNGQVLITGDTLTSEIYDPQSGSWSAAGDMSTTRIFHTATRLVNGKVLVVGGQDSNGALLNTAELFDPVKKTWTLTGSMSVVRESHGAVLLANGQILVAGGASVLGRVSNILASTELFNPATGQFVPGSTMFFARSNFGLIRLLSGRAMAVGGDDRVVGRRLYPGDAETY